MKTKITMLEPSVEVLSQDILNIDLSSPHGPQGPRGYKGDKGDKGDTGPQGPKGEDATVDATLTISGAAADAKKTGDEITSLKGNSYQFRGNLNGADPVTTNVYIGSYASKKKTDSTGYPEDMANHYCVIDYFIVGANRYFFITDTQTGEVWSWHPSEYIKLARNLDVTTLESKTYIYRGPLAESINPTNANVMLGSYSAQVKNTSEGYPADVPIGHYVMINYYCVGSNNNKYFWVTDTHTGNMWFYDSKRYIKMPTESDVYANVGRINAYSVIKNNFAAVGDDVEFSATPYAALKADGTIDIKDQSISNNQYWKVSDEIEVVQGDIYSCSMMQRYSSAIICFYNSARKVIYYITPNEVAKIVENNYTINNFTFSIPYGAAFMRIGYYDRYTACTVKKVSGFALKPKSLTGKKWACIGDSLTDPATTRASKKYYDYIMERTGIEFTNLGKSGTGYANDYNGAGRFIARVPNIPDDADVVTLFGSGNDMNVLPIGTAEDTTETTVMGYVYLTIQAIFTQKPKILLGIIAPTPWMQYPPYSDNNKMLTFVTELEKLCKKYSIPFLDLYHNSNMRPWDATFRQDFYSKDNGNGVHPDENGNARFAPMIQNFIERIVLSAN